jgi:hypothetical protein
VVPNLVGEVAAEVAPDLFKTGVLAIEEATRGEVVGVAADLKLLLGSEMLFRVIV